MAPREHLIGGFNLVQEVREASLRRKQLRGTCQTNREGGHGRVRHRNRAAGPEAGRGGPREGGEQGQRAAWQGRVSLTL